MGLVDGDQADVEPAQRRQHLLGHQPLRRHIKQPRLTSDGAPPRGNVLRPVDRRIDGVGRDPGKAQGGHLVVHECNEGRDDDRDPALDQRRHLIAQRLARSRRHDGQYVPPREQRIHRLLLPRTERVEAEGLFQNLLFYVGSVAG